MNNLNEILKNMQLEKITSEGSGFEDLADGYYLSEVEAVEFTTSKSSGNDMLKWQFKVVEDGIAFDEDANKNYINNTKNRKIFMYHVLKDDKSVKRMLSDLLKFESGEGEPILSAEYFTSREVLDEAIKLLIGSRIFIHLETDDKGQQWSRMSSWKGAKKLELI